MEQDLALIVPEEILSVGALVLMMAAAWAGDRAAPLLEGNRVEGNVHAGMVLERRTHPEIRDNVVNYVAVVSFDPGLPALPPPINFAAGLLDWDALEWRDRLAALRLAGPIRLAQEGKRAEGRGRAGSSLEAAPGRLLFALLFSPPPPRAEGADSARTRPRRRP